MNVKTPIAIGAAAIRSSLFMVSLFLGIATTAEGQVVFNTSTAGQDRLGTGADSTLTFAHTTAGANKLLLVGVSLDVSDDLATAVSTVTHNGTALTFAGFRLQNDVRVELWRLVNPAAAGNVVVTITTTAAANRVGVVAGASSFSGVDQITPLGAFVSNGGTGTVLSLEVASTLGEIVHDVVGVNAANTIAVTTPQVQRWNGNSGGVTAIDSNGAGSTKNGATSVDMVWNQTAAAPWAMGAAAIRPLQADVSVAKTSSPVVASSGQSVAYSMAVRNNGPSIASAVSLTDTLPVGATFVSVATSQGSCAGTGPVTCTIGDLASGATATVTLTVTAPIALGSVFNTATVTSASPADPNNANNTSAAVTIVQSDVCANPGRDGNPGTLAGVVNRYFSGTATANAGTSSLTFANGRGAATPIAVGDLLLVMQMQDAAINSGNDERYGDGSGVAAGTIRSGTGSTNLNASGRFEYVVATAAAPVAGGTVTILGAGPGGGLLNTYTNANATGTQGARRFQVIRVPQYATATLGNTLTALEWDGASGGVLAMDVAGPLALGSATVNLTGLGFRGGAGRALAGGAGADTDYRTLATENTNGAKGEGIAGTPRFVLSGGAVVDTAVEGYPNGSQGRGAPGNGGGGGTDGNPAANDENSGGGGGGNGGPGGIGGYSWNSAEPRGGFGGTFISDSNPASLSRLVLGGGGGAGATNNGSSFPNTNVTGINSSGVSGGGLVIIRAESVTGTGTITSDGSTALDVQQDGGGGGGAGGTVAVFARNGGLGGLTVNARGGKGGDAWEAQPSPNYPDERHGPGGGGGGGVVILSTAAAAVNVQGGVHGISTNAVLDNDYGSVDGDPGVLLTLAGSALPGVKEGAACTVDLSVTNSDSPDPVVAGNVITYTQDVTNNGPNAATSPVFSQNTPPNTTFQSITIPAGWSCTTPAIGGTGAISCTRPTFASGATSSFSVAVLVNAGTPSGTLVTSTAAITTTNDTNGANNVATATTQVVTLAAPRTDVRVTLTDTPDPVTAGANLTLSGTATNAGPDAAGDVVYTINVPANTTFQSLVVPAGWSCSTPAVGGTGTVRCTIANLANGAVANFPLVVAVGGAVPAGTQLNATAQVSSATTDDFPANNSASSTSTVVAAGNADLRVTNLDSPDPVVAGNNITYTQVVVNDGPAAAANATFRQQVPTGTTFQAITIPAGWSCTTPAVGATGAINCTNPSLAAGGSSTFSVVVGVVAGTPAGTVIADTATAGSTTADPNTANNSASVTTTVVAPGTVDLTITNSDFPDPVLAAQAIFYTQVATNNGPSAASNVVVTTVVPPNTTFDSLIVPTGWSCTTPAVGAQGTVSCTIPSLAAGSSASFVFEVTVDPSTSGGTQVSNTARISSASTESNLFNNAATTNTTVAAPNQADLSATVEANADTVLAGGTIRYTQVVQNNGPAGAVDAVFTQNTPTNTVFQSLVVPAGWSCITPAVGVAGAIRCIVPSFAAGADATFLLAVTVNGGTAAGTVITNSATIAAATSDPVPANNVGTDSTRVGTAVQADLSVTNTDSPDPVEPNAIIGYSQTVSNLGLAAAATVSFTQNTPANTTFRSVNAPTGWTCATPPVGGTGAITCTNPSLAAGASADFFVNVMVNAGVAAGTIITDTASVTTATGETTATNNSAATTTTVVAAGSADLSVTNSDSPDPVVAGQHITYSQIVTNNGPATATNAVFNQTTPANTTFQSLTVPPGWSCTTPAIGATGAINCTNPSVAAGVVSDFGLVLRVNNGVANGTLITDTATVSSATPDSIAANNSASATTTVTSPTVTDISITNTGTPSTVQVGTNITYTQVVTNNGPAVSTNLTMSQTTPPNTTFQSIVVPAGWTCTTPAVGATGTITCTAATLAVAATSSFTVVVGLAPGTTSGAMISSTVSVSTSTTETNYLNNSATSGASTAAAATEADLSLTLTDTPDPIVAGTNLTYTAIARNNNPAAAANATFTQSVPAGTTFQSIVTPAGWACVTPAVGGTGVITCTIASLAANATATFPIVVAVPGGTPVGTIISGNGSVSTTTTEPTLSNNSASATTVVVAAGSADLSATITDSPDPVLAGGTITYTEVVRNNGPAAAANAVFTQVTPTNTTFASLVTPAGWTCTTPAVGATGTVNCTNPSLASGVSSTFLLGVNVGAGTASGTVITESVSVSSATADSDNSNNNASTTTLVAGNLSADLSVTNSDSPDPIQPGRDITYTQLVTNNGPSTATNVTVSQVVPPNTTFRSLSVPPGWSCTTPPIGGTGSITCSVPSFGLGDVANFGLVVNVNSTAPAGSVIRDTVSVSSTTFDPNPSNNSSSADTQVVAPSEADLFVSTSDSPDPVQAGAVLSYAQRVGNNGPSAATNFVFTQQVPLNTTFLSLSVPAGLACTTPAVGATGTITCTAANVASGFARDLVLRVTVNPGTPSGTVITNAVNVSATTNDSNSSNNSASATTTVAAAGSADLSVVVDTQTPTVLSGNTVVFTETVRNSGPSNAANVTFTHVVPAGTTFESLASPPGWTCTTPALGATGTITCTKPTVAVGEVASFTSIFTTDPNLPSGTLIPTSASVSSPTADPNSANNSDTAEARALRPTIARLRSMKARSSNGLTLVQWQTGYEHNNLGFHVYRETTEGRIRITPTVVAGSAFIAGRGVSLGAGFSYQWTDRFDARGRFTQYWLEDVDLNGKRTLHGPFAPEVSGNGSSLTVASNSLTLSELSKGSAPSLAIGAASNWTLASNANDLNKQIELAGSAAAKIQVRHEGWIRVTKAQISAAGFDAGTDSRSLQLYTEGIEQKILIDDGGDNRFDAADAIEFYGYGLDTSYAGERMYWLVSGRGPGQRLKAKTKAKRDASTARSFAYTVERRERFIYFSSLTSNGEAENFFGPVVANYEQTNQALKVSNLDTAASSASIEVTIQGVTLGEAHRTQVSLNGRVIGEINFFGEENKTASFSVPVSQLVSGENLVTLFALAGEDDVSLLERVRITYPHLYRVDDGVLRLSSAGDRAVAIGGFSNANVRIVDVTNPLDPEEVDLAVKAEGTTYTATATLVGMGERMLYAFTPAQAIAPASIRSNEVSTLSDRRNEADFVIVAHPSFRAAVEPLAQKRRAEGLTTMVVSVDDIFDEYSFGAKSAVAIRDFFAATQKTWKKVPRYALLVGDATFDPKDYQGFGDLDFVPTKLVNTLYLETASDDWFGDMNGDSVPEIAIGRLPGRTTADITGIVAKIAGYRGSNTRNALFVADSNDEEFNFETATRVHAALLPASYSKLFIDIGRSPAARTDILNALNAGSSIVNYTGHGSVEVWAKSGLFNSGDARALTNGSKLPVVIAMNCLNGFFHDVFTYSMAEALMQAPNGGAVAVWASSGLTEPDGQLLVSESLYRDLFSAAPPTIGDAMKKAKKATTDLDVRKTWILFGDPTMKLLP